jgi:HD-GYP domain-containing protein (c-di-GMP phosphodiesterase class II)
MNADTSSTQEFIRNLLSATANASLYSIAHQQVERLIDTAFSRISQVLEDNHEITIVVIESELVINGQPQEFSLFLNRFADIMKSRGISHVRLLEGLSREEIVRLVSALTRQGIDDGTSSSEHVILGQAEVRFGGGTRGSAGPCTGEGTSAVPITDMPKEEIERFEEIYEAVKQRHKLKVTGIFDIVSGFVDAFRQEGDSMLAMASLRNTDEYTFTHSTNVCILNIAQAMSMGIEGQLLHDIGIAAMLHDIGKLFIPEEILTKKDKLTPKEFEIMKQHPVLGAKHLLDTPGVPRLAVTAAYEHHLKYNTTGYPSVQSGWQPNLCSQMTMISDFFDALRTRRSYREPMELSTIAAMMQERAGTDLHPGLTRNFLRIISRLAAASDSPAP